jgi:glutamate dehydrogenase
MAAADLPGSDEERAEAALIAAAGKILRGDNREVPEDFVAALFAYAVPEDLLRYDPRQLAELAADAWSLLAVRKPGVPKIRLNAPDLAGHERLRADSVLEIVNDDMPFLVDSVLAELAERGLDVRFVVHPVLTVVRDDAGRLTAFKGAKPAAGALRESVIYVHIERIEEEARRAEIVEAIERVLADVRVCVHDWRAMMARVADVIAGLKADPPPLPAAEIEEAVAFLEWLADDNFTFLGVRDYRFTDAEEALEPVFETGLGILRSRDLRVLRRWNEPLVITPQMRAVLQQPTLLIVTKSAVRSRVHRRIYMDYVGVKRFDRRGKLVGEFRIVGLFTSTAYTRSMRSIPYLRRKVDAVMRRAGFDPDGHSGKALVNVLENYPRDELFQLDEDTLYQFALAVLQLDERPRVRVLPRRDRFDRFASILVYVPRERYGSGVRKAIGDYLADAYKGRVSAFHPFFPEGQLVRVHFIIALSPGESANPDRASLERAVEAIVRTWVDELGEELARNYDALRGRALFKRYREAFSQGYRENYSPVTAVGDIRVMEGLSPSRPLGVDFHRHASDAKSCLGLKVWSFNRPIPLSERVPVLENIGFKVVDERTYQIARQVTQGAQQDAQGETQADAREADVWFHDMMLERADGRAVDLHANKRRLEAAFLVVMRGGAENDGYNALVLAAGLMWREVALIRTISRFLRQVQVPYSQGYMWATLGKHAPITADLVQLFAARFDPRLDVSGEERKAREGEIADRIEAALAAVESLDEDRILRRFVNAITAAIRTNFYQIDAGGQPKQLIAVKFASRALDALPLPRPRYEVFIYSPRVEALHLRFGKVARGGIRWSDRPQDFRTEILGLAKAQQVKNAVIVPVGAKGGFVPKLLKAASREVVQAEGMAAYKLFVSTLLDITDNLRDGKVVAPDNVVRHDDDDPYLVVAADKGTATFSDLANAISQEHHFWLDDAFASGGSAGYDHKKMGITARGAWESVKRHFREMDVDIAKTPFTTVGVGDMSGDVFGNAMLQARTIRLVAAFDHRDIFIDPAPDPQTSFAERRRLFDLPRSSWQDYDRKLISAGGGVFSRATKEIALSPEARAALGLATPKATPHEVIRAILKAPVDLLFFGGIGTYVRAVSEGDDAVGDRGNDALRVTGAELRAKVIGEGANLGMTQRGRIEAALRGIRLNTDAIDNSAGVNTSDLEVNIKIALAPPMRDGRLSREARDVLLAAMTEDVAALVLRNNYLQPLAISLAERRGLEDLGFEQRLMQTLERAGELDRAVEFLPDDVEIAERRRRSQALTRPELSVLLAYAKLSLNHELVQSNVPDDPYLGRELGRYFPAAIADKFPDAIAQHRLRREIIATQLANSMINRGGPSLVVRIADQTGASAAQIAAAFAAVRDSYGMTALNSEIDALDAKIPGGLQLELYHAVEDLLLDRVVWFLRNAELTQGLAGIVAHYREGIAAVEVALEAALPQAPAGALAAREAELRRQGVPEALARRIAALPVLVGATDIVLVADRTGRPIAEVAATYFAAAAFFRLDRIVAAARGIVIADYFDRLALDRALDSIGEAERRLTAAMTANAEAGRAAVEAWVAPRKAEVERISMAINEIANSGLTLSKLSVAASLLGDLARTEATRELNAGNGARR